ncbi:MAG: lysophospholipid acyltransferase family protein [Gemmatimonadaceae bacterium]|nr:lysophospholipid acyltransferase family protein [Gemmatimonadaceae bacterium]
MSIPIASGEAAPTAPPPSDNDLALRGGVAPRPAWELGPQMPHTRAVLLQWLGRWLLRRAGWTFEGVWPDVPKVVTIVAPHTSNWDFPVGLAAKWSLRFDAHWWGKDTLFLPPLGWFMRANGGLPVDRKNATKVVDKTIAEMRAASQFALVLAPEGTRKKVTQWRSGFWHVAKGANVPICCVAFDWSRKVIRIGPTTMPTSEDANVGISRIRRYYDDVRGYNPEQQA